MPATPDMAGWAGFRVQAVFSAADFDRRINLVEADLAFAFFVEEDASLQGTIYDGTTWYGVKSAPGVIVPGAWHVGDFEYNPSTALVLRLDGQIVDLLITHGDPVRSVGPVGIKVGYWPGGDGRYTFLGLLGPIRIDTLDPANDLAGIIGKVVCPGSGYELETLQQIYEQALTPAEQAQVGQVGTAVPDGADAVLAAMLGTAGDVQATIAACYALEQDIQNLLLADEAAGVNVFTDPALTPLLNKGLDLVWSNSANARDTLLVQALKIATLSLGFSPARVEQLLAQYPGLCATTPSTTGFDPGGVISGGLGGIVGGCWPAGGQPGTGTGTGTGMGAGTGSGTSSSGTGCSCGPPAASGGCAVHIHVHCDRGGKQ